MTHRFDIVMPFHGDVALMQQAVRSVLAQDTDGWHLTVVDDCMPDDRVPAWFATLHDPRVTYLRNEHNLGANANYRKALGLATAEYLVVMGADDLMLPNYVRTLTRALAKHPEASIVQPGVRVVDGGGVVVRPLADRIKDAARPRVSSTTVLSGERLATSLLHGNWTYFPSLCWRVDHVQRLGFRPGLNVVQDLALLVDVLLDGGSMVIEPEVAFHYRRHADSDSSVRAISGDRFTEERAFFRRTAEAVDRRGWSTASRAARWHVTSRLNAASVALRALRSKDVRAGTALIRHTFAR